MYRLTWPSPVAKVFRKSSKHHSYNNLRSFPVGALHHQDGSVLNAGTGEEVARLLPDIVVVAIIPILINLIVV